MNGVTDTTIIVNGRAFEVSVAVTADGRADLGDGLHFWASPELIAAIEAGEVAVREAQYLAKLSVEYAQ